MMMMMMMMSGAQVKMTDSVSLFGGRVPAEVEQLSKHLKNLDRDTFTHMLSGER